MNKPDDIIEYMHELGDWMDSEKLEWLTNELECIDNSEFKDLNMDEFLNEMY
jgi:hypothetical protein